MATNKNSEKRIFITGGGTGGHIYPALAIAKEIREQNFAKVFYLGKKNSLEQKIAHENNFDFLSYDIFGMPRKLSFNFIKWFIKLQMATFKALFYCYKYKPQAIFGTGGYASAPTLLAAQIANIPYIIHDCDANPGIVSRYCSKSAVAVSLAFAEAKDKMQNKNIFINGNPLRKEFSLISKDEARNKLKLENKLTLMIMGGSQGAKAINDKVLPILKNLLNNDIQIIFQTGVKNYNAVINQLEEIFPEYDDYPNLIIEPYFDEMVYPLKAADVVISRAGSLSISEICACSLASILIPYPYAAQNHQLKNALSLEKSGAALCIEEKDLTSEILQEKVLSLKASEEFLSEMQKKAFENSHLGATNSILNLIKRIFNE